MLYWIFLHIISFIASPEASIHRFLINSLQSRGERWVVWDELRWNGLSLYSAASSRSRIWHGRCSCVGSQITGNKCQSHTDTPVLRTPLNENYVHGIWAQIRSLLAPLWWFVISSHSVSLCMERQSSLCEQGRRERLGLWASFERFALGAPRAEAVNLSQWWGGNFL